MVHQVSSLVGGGLGIAVHCRDEPFPVPLVDLAFSVKPVGQVASVFIIPVLPEFMRSSGDLFFQADVFINCEGRNSEFVVLFAFHDIE